MSLLGKCKIFYSAATKYGADLAGLQGVEVLCGRMDAAGFAAFIADSHIDLVADFSHPFASGVSADIDKACHGRVAVVRYNRMMKPYSVEYDKTVYCDSFEHAAELSKPIADEGKTVFLTIGANYIPLFTRHINPLFIAARVLNTQESIEVCLTSGIPRHNILTGLGPFSVVDNVRAFTVFDTGLVVSKDSGETGGTPQKIEAAKRLGLPILLIRPPKKEYNQCFANFEDIIHHILSIVGDRDE